MKAETIKAYAGGHFDQNSFQSTSKRMTAYFLSTF